MEAAFHRTQRDTQLFGDISLGQFLPIAQTQDLPVTPGQPLHRLLHRTADQTAATVYQLPLRDLLKGNRFQTKLLSEIVIASIPGNLQNP